MCSHTLQPMQVKDTGLNLRAYSDLLSCKLVRHLHSSNPEVLSLGPENTEICVVELGLWTMRSPSTLLHVHCLDQKLCLALG